MQVFLPYPNFALCVRVLDRQRLGKQRIEAFQILNAIANYDSGKKAGWVNHPACVMFRGHPAALSHYGWLCCTEWLSRGYRDTMLGRFAYAPAAPRPSWLGDDRLHRSHRSNLVRKDAAFYGGVFDDVDGSLPYWWPTEGGK